MNGKKARKIRKDLRMNGIYYDNAEYEILNHGKNGIGTIGLTSSCGRSKYLKAKADV